jgi:hypothetical protein
MNYQYNDGGRSEAGYKGSAGDCVCRAIAIATEQNYGKVYDDLNRLIASMRQTKRVKTSHPRKGINRKIYDAYLKSLGWNWTPTVKIGTGCKIHLSDKELPKGRLIVRVSKHLTSVIEGVLNDTYDCSRGESRCVYGYYSKSL